MSGTGQQSDAKRNKTKEKRAKQKLKQKLKSQAITSASDSAVGSAASPAAASSNAAPRAALFDKRSHRLTAQPNASTLDLDAALADASASSSSAAAAADTADGDNDDIDWAGDAAYAQIVGGALDTDSDGAEGEKTTDAKTSAKRKARDKGKGKGSGKAKESEPPNAGATGSSGIGSAIGSGSGGKAILCEVNTVFVPTPQWMHAVVLPGDVPVGDDIDQLVLDQVVPRFRLTAYGGDDKAYLKDFTVAYVHTSGMAFTKDKTLAADFVDGGGYFVVQPTNPLPNLHAVTTPKTKAKTKHQLTAQSAPIPTSVAPAPSTASASLSDRKTAAPASSASEVDALTAAMSAAAPASGGGISVSGGQFSFMTSDSTADPFRFAAPNSVAPLALPEAAGTSLAGPASALTAPASDVALQRELAAAKQRINELTSSLSTLR